VTLHSTATIDLQWSTPHTRFDEAQSFSSIGVRVCYFRPAIAAAFYLCVLHTVQRATYLDDAPKPEVLSHGALGPLQPISTRSIECGTEISAVDFPSKPWMRLRLSTAALTSTPSGSPMSQPHGANLTFRSPLATRQRILTRRNAKTTSSRRATSAASGTPPLSTRRSLHLAPPAASRADRGIASWFSHLFSSGDAAMSLAQKVPGPIQIATTGPNNSFLVGGRHTVCYRPLVRVLQSCVGAAEGE
jgi:hypothetical protein